MRKSKNEKRYIPKKVLSILNDLEYRRKDDLYCIIDIIYRSQIYFKNELQKKYRFVEIPRKRFQKLIGDNNNVNSAIQFLIQKEIILRNEWYEYGTKAKGYKILSELLSPQTPVEITDKRINARIKKDKLARRKIRVKNLEFAKSKYYKTFKIDVEAALEAATQRALLEIKNITGTIFKDEQLLDVIRCEGDYEFTRAMILMLDNGHELHNILHRLMNHQLSIHAINDGFLFFKRNTTNGRLDSNLTSLPAYLRKYIRSNKKLYSLDIKNSQPYFLYTKLINHPNLNRDELAKYCELVTEGRLYEYLCDAYEQHHQLTKFKTRIEMKKMLFKIFYSKPSSFKSYKDFFRLIFPSIMNYINETNAEQHNTLAIGMTKEESKTILDVIMVELEKLDIKPYTIHDSFIVTEDEVETVITLVNDNFTKLYDIPPKLHKNGLFEVDTIECVDDLIIGDDIELAA